MMILNKKRSVYMKRRLRLTNATGWDEKEYILKSKFYSKMTFTKH